MATPRLNPAGVPILGNMDLTPSGGLAPTGAGYQLDVGSDAQDEAMARRQFRRENPIVLRDMIRMTDAYPFLPGESNAQRRNRLRGQLLGYGQAGTPGRPPSLPPLASPIAPTPSSNPLAPTPESKIDTRNTSPERFVSRPLGEAVPRQTVGASAISRPPPVFQSQRRQDLPYWNRDQNRRGPGLPNYMG